MDNIEELELYENAKTALRFFVEHPLWKDYLKYENHVISNLERAAVKGNLADAAYTIRKAHAQGVVEGLHLLQEGRLKLLKGDSYGQPIPIRRQTARKTTIGRFDDA